MSEWHLRFQVEEPAAVLRFRHLSQTFAHDDHVESVEISEDSSEPEVRGLIVRFKQGREGPRNRVLRALNKIHGEARTSVRPRLQRLLDDDFFED